MPERELDPRFKPFIDQAYTFVEQMARQAGHIESGSPMWYASALREAFLAGIEAAQKKETAALPGGVHRERDCLDKAMKERDEARKAARLLFWELFNGPIKPEHWWPKNYPWLEPTAAPAAEPAAAPVIEEGANP